MNPTQIEALLKQALPNHHHIAVNTRDQVHFEAVIVSEIFINESRIARQRRINAILGPYLQSGEIHALALKTLTPEEWQAKEAS